MEETDTTSKEDKQVIRVIKSPNSIFGDTSLLKKEKVSTFSLYKNRNMTLNKKK